MKSNKIIKEALRLNGKTQKWLSNETGVGYHSIKQFVSTGKGMSVDSVQKCFDRLNVETAIWHLETDSPSRVPVKTTFSPGFIFKPIN